MDVVYGLIGCYYFVFVDDFSLLAIYVVDFSWFVGSFECLFFFGSLVEIGQSSQSGECLGCVDGEDCHEDSYDNFSLELVHFLV